MLESQLIKNTIRIKEFSLCKYSRIMLYNIMKEENIETGMLKRKKHIICLIALISLK